MKIFSFKFLRLRFFNDAWYYFPVKWNNRKWWKPAALTFEIKKIPSAKHFPHQHILTIYFRLLKRMGLVHIEST